MESVPKTVSALALSRITCPDVYYRACCMLRLTNDGYGHLNSALTMCCFQLRLKPLGYFISIALVFKGFGARLQNSQLNIKFFSVLTLKRHNTRDQRSPRCCFVGHEHVFSSMCHWLSLISWYQSNNEFRVFTASLAAVCMWIRLTVSWRAEEWSGFKF